MKARPSILAQLPALLLVTFLLMGITSDKRANLEKPVGRIEFQQTWITGEGHAAKTLTRDVNGTIGRVDVILSSVTGNPTVIVTLRDQNSAIVVPDAFLNALADGTNHTFRAWSNLGTPDADFNAVPHNGNITVSMDPSADAGGAGQTLTATVILYVI